MYLANATTTIHSTWESLAHCTAAQHIICRLTTTSPNQTSFHALCPNSQISASYLRLLIVANLYRYYHHHHQLTLPQSVLDKHHAGYNPNTNPRERLRLEATPPSTQYYTILPSRTCNTHNVTSRAVRTPYTLPDVYPCRARHGSRFLPGTCGGTPVSPAPRDTYVHPSTHNPQSP
jgi:hypothetical protein